APLRAVRPIASPEGCAGGETANRSNALARIDAAACRSSTTCPSRLRRRLRAVACVRSGLLGRAGPPSPPIARRRPAPVPQDPAHGARPAGPGPPVDRDDRQRSAVLDPGAPAPTLRRASRSSISGLVVEAPGFGKSSPARPALAGML